MYNAIFYLIPVAITLITIIIRMEYNKDNLRILIRNGFFDSFPIWITSYILFITINGEWGYLIKITNILFIFFCIGWFFINFKVDVTKNILFAHN